MVSPASTSTLSPALALSVRPLLSASRSRGSTRSALSSRRSGEEDGRGSLRENEGGIGKKVSAIRRKLAGALPFAFSEDLDGKR